VGVNASRDIGETQASGRPLPRHSYPGPLRKHPLPIRVKRLRSPSKKPHCPHRRGSENSTILSGSDFRAPTSDLRSRGGRAHTHAHRPDTQPSCGGTFWKSSWPGVHCDGVFLRQVSHLQNRCCTLEPRFQSIFLWLSWRWESNKLYAGPGLQLQPFLPASQVARITGMSHTHTKPNSSPCLNTIFFFICSTGF
jgi:hypothetical protein